MTGFLIRSFIKDHKDTASAEVRTAYGKFSGTVGIIANVLLFTAKLLAGLFSGSVAIIADAVNNLTDAASSIVSLLGFKMAAKPADPEHPYGHARYEYLAGLAVSVMILLIGIELMQSGIEKILHPVLPVFRWLSVIILALSILVKLWLSLFNRRIGNLIDSGALLAASADSRNDVISTSAVLAATLIAHFWQINLDGVIGLLVALFILYSGVMLIRETVSPLLGRAPEPEYVRDIEEKVLSYPGVLGIHDLLIHDYGPGRKFASIHVEMAAEGDVLENHDVIDNIEREFLKEGLNLIVHFDPVVTSDALLGELRTWLAEEVKRIRPTLSIHDLRTVPGPTHTNVIFDLVIPHEYAAEELAIKDAIRTAVSRRYPDHFCVITVDQDFSSHNR